MASRQYEMVFKLNAQVAGSYNSAFKAAQKEILTYQKEIQTLNATAANISGFQKQSTAVAEAQKKMERLQQQYDNIQREIQETGTFSSDLENKLISKSGQIDKASEAVQIATDKLERYKKALADAGINTDDLSGETGELQEKIKELRQRQEEAAEGFEEFEESGTDAAEALQEALVAAGITKVLKEILNYISECTEAAIEFESAMTGVAKTTDMSEAELAAISEEIQNLSTEIPITTTELAAVAETAGQLGIAKENLLEFSTVMSMLATATTMTADEGATLLAQFANITQMNPAFYSNLASTIVYLGNNYATTEQKITGMSQGIAASASLAGMSEADMLGLAAAVSSLGIEEQMGATSVSKLTSELMTAVETGEGLEDFARVANMSASEFKTAWGRDAAGALAAFVTGLSDTERLGQSAIVTLTDLGITETRMQRTILSLSNSGDLLTNAIASANSAWEDNTALVDEANKRYATTESQQKMMQNAYKNLQVELGENFTPVLKEIYGMANGLFSGVATFVDKAPGATKAIGALTIGGAAFAASLTAIVVVTKAWKVAQDALNESLKANHYLMTISTIIGVATALGTLIAALSSADEEVEQLSATSEAQRLELEALREEYETVCEAQGETSAEAQILKEEIEEQTEAFEQNKKTQQEYLDARKEILDSSASQEQSYRDAIKNLDIELESTSNLIDTLNELTSAEEASAIAKERIAAIVDILNERIPELGLNYDDLTGKLNMTPEQVKAAVQYEIDYEKNEEKRKSLRDAMLKEVELTAERDEDQKAADVLRAEYDRYSAVVNELRQYERNIYEGDGSEYYVSPDGSKEYWYGKYDDALQDAIDKETLAKKVWEEQDKLAKESQEALDNNLALQEELSTSLSTYKEEIEEVSYGTEEMAVVSEGLIETLETLQTAYTEAYEAAYESISGQYSLWDEVADVSATSVQKTIESIQGQAQYWSDYNSNIETLLKYAPDISGLSEMVASFADGSEESVNMIAGMTGSIKDGDTTALRDMVAAWLDLKTQQQETAESLAELETGIGEETKEIIAHFTNEVEQLNLSEEAKESGMSTIMGYIEGAESLLPDVSTAYQRVANAVRSTLYGSGGSTSHSYSHVRPSAYASGTLNADRGWKWVGEEGPELMWTGGGEVILPADISAHVAAGSPLEALSSNNRHSGDIVVHFAPSYQISGADPDRLEALLRDHDDAMRESIAEIVADVVADHERRVYN